MCNITIEYVKPIINILSALLTPTIAIISTIFICQQKNIQRRQHLVEVFKLRIDHIKFFFNSWGSFNTYINYIPNYKAQIIAQNNNQEYIISSMEQVFAELYKHNLSTKMLFNEELFDIESNFINSLRNNIPSRGQDWTIYNILESYEDSRNKFNELYEKYVEILNKDNIISKN